MRRASDRGNSEYHHERRNAREELPAKVELYASIISLQESEQNSSLRTSAGAFQQFRHVVQVPVLIPEQKIRWLYRQFITD
jgi:hypothetical protein